jgi:exodeoxyribonuclease VII large subunit
VADENLQLGLMFAAPARRVWTVRDLVSAARTSLEREYTDVYVEGEISNYRPADSGHLYFTLKDGDSQLRIVMFRTQARLLRFKPQNGLQVIARGRISIYEQRGEMQLMAEHLEPKGAGALQVAFEQLKAKLAQEGLFEASRKKPIPAMPMRIGVVTSTRGAAVQDIINVLQRRHESVHLLIFPAQVQGEYAAAEVAAGVKWFNQSHKLHAAVEVIIVARGGGSAEDLAAFNDEMLARAIAASEVPVISAVGHETDFTICDFVADLRAPTPSAAAELVVESKRHVEERVAELHKRLGRSMRYRLLMARKELVQLAQHAAFGSMRDLLRRRQQRVDELVFRLASAESAALKQYRRRLDIAGTRLQHHDFGRVLAGMRRAIEADDARLRSAAQHLLARQRARFAQAAGKLEALSPVAILERGYALVFDEQGKLVKDAEQVASGDEVRTRVARGEFTSTVKNKS